MKPNKPKIKARGGLDVLLEVYAGPKSLQKTADPHQLRATIDHGLFYPFSLCCPFEKTVSLSKYLPSRRYFQFRALPVINSTCHRVTQKKTRQTGQH